MLHVDVTAADLKSPGCPVERALRRRPGWERAMVGTGIALRDLEARPVLLDDETLAIQERADARDQVSA